MNAKKPSNPFLKKASGAKPPTRAAMKSQNKRGGLGNPDVKTDGTFAFAPASFIYGSSDRVVLGSYLSGSAQCQMLSKDGGYVIPPLNYLTAAIDRFHKCNSGDPTVTVSSSVPNANRVLLEADTAYSVTADFQANAQTVGISGGGYTGQTVLQHNATMANTGHNLYAFARNNAGTADLLSAARIYSLKIWKDGELVRHYVPVIADNGGPYLYDKVTRTFAQGATSGLWDVGVKGERISQGTCVLIR